MPQAVYLLTYQGGPKSAQGVVRTFPRAMCSLARRGVAAVNYRARKVAVVGDVQRARSRPLRVSHPLTVQLQWRAMVTGGDFSLDERYIMDL